MHEYITKAVVLDKQTRNDADARYSLFTERYGKIAAKAKSARKIVSKLAGHLEPGTLATVRVIEQHGAQLVDALKIAKVDVPMLDLASLNNLLPEWQPEEELWAELASAASHGAPESRAFSWERTLAILGWDPQGASCARCGRNAARHFHIPRQEFFCASCAAASRFGRDKILLVS